MANKEECLDKEYFTEKFQKLSLHIEQLTDEVSKMKHKLDKSNKINRSFGLKSLRNSEPLDFAKDVVGIGSPTKRYLLSVRAITEEWKGTKNDVLIAVRQQEKETHMDIKSLGIRIPIDDIKNFRILVREIIALLYVACELKNVEITEILKEILNDVNRKGSSMINEIRQKMRF